MGAFQYNNPVISFMVKVANMMIVSFYWLLCCLPVVTILPSCAALFHCVNKVVFGSGSGVTRDFFSSFKSALKPGVLMSAVFVVLGILIAIGIRTGMAIWDVNLFGTVYMAMGVLIVVLFSTVLIYIPPTLSRFEGGMTTIIRLAVYFSGKHLLRSMWYVVLLAVVVFAIDFFPLLLLLLPALYTDLIRGGVEKEMKRYIEEAGLEDAEEAEAASPPEADTMSALELDQMLSGREEQGGQHA